MINLLLVVIKYGIMKIMVEILLCWILSLMMKKKFLIHQVLG